MSKTEEMSMEELQIQRYNNSCGDLNEHDRYDCQKCKNKGFIATLDENNTMTLKYCRCQSIREIIRNVKKSGLGDTIAKYKFNNFQTSENWQKEIKQKAIDFCSDDESKWFYIGGQSGCGKSHICTAITLNYIERGYNAVYMLWCEDAKRIKSFITDSGYAEALQKYKDAKVLYIDDFLKTRGKETPTTADINLAFEIINHRTFDNSKITIISSEKTLDDLLEYDEATMSRIFEKAGKYKISIGSDRKKNYRLSDKSDT